MAQSIYGGRVDNEFDQRLLNTFLERLFTTRSFDSEFKLACKVDGHKDIQMPDGIRCVPSPGTRRAGSRHFRRRADGGNDGAAFPGGRSSCSGWSCSPTPRRPPGWASPTTPRGSCSPPRVGTRRLPPQQGQCPAPVGISSAVQPVLGRRLRIHVRGWQSVAFRFCLRFRNDFTFFPLRY